MSSGNVAVGSQPASPTRGVARQRRTCAGEEGEGTMIRPVTPNDGYPCRMLPGSEWNPNDANELPQVSLRGMEMLRVLNDILDDANQHTARPLLKTCAN